VVAGVGFEPVDGLRPHPMKSGRKKMPARFSELMLSHKSKGRSPSLRPYETRIGCGGSQCFEGAGSAVLLSPSSQRREEARPAASVMTALAGEVFQQLTKSGTAKHRASRIRHRSFVGWVVGWKNSTLQSPPTFPITVVFTRH
jgi:hypothetical protein